MMIENDSTFERLGKAVKEAMDRRRMSGRLAIFQPGRCTKRDFVERYLADTLKQTDKGIFRLILSEDEKNVYVVYDTGDTKLIDVTGDNLNGILTDVIEAV